MESQQAESSLIPRNKDRHAERFDIALRAMADPLRLKMPAYQEQTWIGQKSVGGLHAHPDVIRFADLVVKRLAKRNSIPMYCVEMVREKPRYANWHASDQMFVQGYACQFFHSLRERWLTGTEWEAITAIAIDVSQTCSLKMEHLETNDLFEPGIFYHREWLDILSDRMDV